MAPPPAVPWAHHALTVKDPHLLNLASRAPSTPRARLPGKTPPADFRLREHPALSFAAGQRDSLMDPAFSRPQTARSRPQTPRNTVAPPLVAPPPQSRSGSAAPRRVTYAEPPAWARQSWDGRSSAASSPRKVGSPRL